MINEKEIRTFYRILRHGDMRSRVHCQGKTGALSSTLVQGEDAVVAWAKEWDSKGQCYIGRNPMVEWGKAGPYTCLTFDIDPHYDKKLGATDVQNQTAIKAGQRVLARYPGACFASSGNGVLLVYSLPQDLSRELNGTLHPAYVALNEEIKSEIESKEPVNVDVLADPERLLRLIGTKNVKGIEANHRMSKFLFLPPAGRVGHSSIFTRLREIAQAKKSKPKVQVTAPDDEPWVTTALKGLPAGKKHVTIIRLAGYFGGKRIPVDIAKKLILEANANAEDEPAAEDDVIFRIDDVYRRIRSGKYDAIITDAVPEYRSLTESSDIYLNELKSRAQHSAPELLWPFPDLNRMTWGIPREAMIVLGAWTGKGKTSIAMTATEALNATGKSVLYVPTEMSTTEIKSRYISVATGIANIDLVNGQVMNKPELKKRFEDFYPDFLERKLFILESPRLNIDAVKRGLDKNAPDFVVIDFLQRLASRSDSRRREVAEFVMALKDELQKGKIAGLLLSQFHRPNRAQNGKYFAPTLFDFAECGDIENTADISILLHPPLDEKGYVTSAADEDIVKPVSCHVAKNRHTGITGYVNLQVDTSTTKFSQI